MMMGGRWGRGDRSDLPPGSLVLLALVTIAAGLLAVVLSPATASVTGVAAAPLQAAQVFTATGAVSTTLQSTVGQFRTSLGGSNNGVVSGTFPTGRREINWDAVPNTVASPNQLPATFFNVTSTRGAVFSTPGWGFEVSASSATTTPVRFGNIDPYYTDVFTTFSPERLFTARGSNVLDVTFFVPGTSVTATVGGFGAVFADVDLTNTTSIEYFSPSGASIGKYFAPAQDGGLSFVGVSFDQGERIARVRITSGNAPLAGGVTESPPTTDLVTLDDFIYGEPQAAPTVFSASAAVSTTLQSTVNDFRVSLGGSNNGVVSGTFPTGRREINWDGVPNGFASPNQLPATFFNVTSTRGVVFSTPGWGFEVSASSATTTPVRFGNIDPYYTDVFTTFSPERLFTARGSNVLDVAFFVPGTNVTATVGGFGAVFADVDLTNTTSIEYFSERGGSLGQYFAPIQEGGLSFLGVTFPSDRVSRVRITSGNGPLEYGWTDAPPTRDAVALDDFIYGEPQAITSTVTPTPTVTGTLTATPTGTATGSQTPAATGTVTGTGTPATTPSPTVSRTAAATGTGTATSGTPSVTASATVAGTSRSLMPAIFRNAASGAGW